MTRRCLLLVGCLLITAVGSGRGETTGENIGEATAATVAVRELPSLVDWRVAGKELSESELKKLPMPETGFENVRELRHLQAPKLERVMAFIAESMGEKCRFCHDLEDYSSDDDHHKVLARKMVEAVQYANGEVFGQDRVACFTCHRGTRKPAGPPKEFSDLPSFVSKGKPAVLPKDYENVRLLRHLPEDDYYLVMDLFRESLGARRCSYCHERRDFAADSKPTKVEARKMIRMLAHFNGEIFKESLINCFHCHQGVAHPIGTPEGWQFARKEGESSNSSGERP